MPDGAGDAVGFSSVCGDPDGLLVELRAQANCEAKATAVIEVHAQGAGSTCPCGEACPATATCGIKLPGTPPIQGTVDVSGESSYAPVFGFDGSGQCVENSRDPTLAEYEWSLQYAPGPGLDGGSGYASASISPNGKTTAAVTTLSYTMAGAHIIQLKVTDAKSRVSNVTTFTVNLSTP